VTRGIKNALLESVGDLPIKAPKDNWEMVEKGGAKHIERTFELQPDEVKMLVCDIIDAQEHLSHQVRIVIDGNRVTIRSTTHEFGEPTERDREIARYIDTSYDEIRRTYR
jgi:pterin-4a-carbinolamine dehydratase